MHSTNVIDDGYLGSGKILKYSFAKHGRENHQRTILEHLPSREALKLRETEVVNEKLLSNPLNMNLKYGGEGGFLAEANKTNGFHRKGAIAANVIRKKRFQEKMKDPAFRQSWMDAIQKNRRKPENFKHSEETKHQMSLSHQGKHDGVLNSQFGSCWVTKNDQSVKIKKTSLSSYEADGFIRGRIIFPKR